MMEVTVSFRKLDSVVVLFREGFPLRSDTISAPIRGMTQDERVEVVKSEFVRLLTNYAARWKGSVTEVHADPMKYGGIGSRDFVHWAREAIREACRIAGAEFFVRSPDNGEMTDAKKVCRAYKLGHTQPVLRAVAIALSLRLTLADDRLLPVMVPKKKPVIPQDPNRVTIPGLAAVMASPLKKAMSGKPITVKELRLLILYNFGRIITSESADEAKKVKLAHNVIMDLAKLEGDGKVEQLEELAKDLQKKMGGRR